jgi:PadR family transcriptional regulator, regulatory protein PadR
MRKKDQTWERSGEARVLDPTEQLVLLALARRRDGDGYGAAVRREIAEVGGRTLALATVYATLERLERGGLVRSWRSEPLPERGGRARKCYSLEPAGARLLVQSRAAFDKLWEGLELEPARR